MALEEVSFYNIVGEEVNLSNIVNQMIDYYDQKLEVGETRVTDFNEGSEIRNLLEAVAVLGFAVLEDENEAGKLPFKKSTPRYCLREIQFANKVDLSKFSIAWSSARIMYTA